MLQIHYQSNWYEIEYCGIKIIETAFTTKLIKSMLDEHNDNSKLILDNKKIKWKNVIYINEMTKINDFLSLSKNNHLYKQIIDLIADQSLVNDALIKKIITTINQNWNLGELISEQYDLNKIVLACFELNDLGYISDEHFFDLLNQIQYDEKKLIIFDNVSYINYQKCKKLLNNFNVLVITTDIRNVISNHSELELCCLLGDNKCFDIIDSDKLISYLELKLATQIKPEEINNYLFKKTDFKSQQINFYLKNLV